MSRFKNTRFDRIGDTFGYGGCEVGSFYTTDPRVRNVILFSPIALEALDLVSVALRKFQRFEMSHAEFISEVEGILLDYVSAT